MTAADAANAHKSVLSAHAERRVMANSLLSEIMNQIVNCCGDAKRIGQTEATRISAQVCNDGQV